MDMTFIGLIPAANKKIGKTIGKELEVTDIDAIINNGKDEPKKINEIVRNDYNELYKESPELFYWESHITLDKKLEDISSIKEIKPLTLENIFEIIPKVIRRTTDLTTGEETEIRVVDEWYESHVLHPDEFVLSFEDALNAYWASDLRTTGNKIAMRRPINPIYKQPYYIFGQIDSPNFVFVNAVTGEVTIDGLTSKLD